MAFLPRSNRREETNVAIIETFLVETGAGLFRRLSSDVRANVLAMVAAALIPLCGMVGGGLDLSRMYIVKTRLQHACDAGALAGRKIMGSGTWAQQSYLPRTTAERFFDANMRDNVFGSGAITRSFVENAGKVTGTASATLPMTLMRVLGVDEKTLSVTCETEMRLPNTDVMFVLDVTGSMNCRAGDTTCTNNNGVPAPDSKIGGLKVAVKCFYEVVARLDTNAACDGGAPSGGTGDQIQIRFGFVPYASNVNVGGLLPSEFLADQWTYQSRVRDGSDWAATWTDSYYSGRSNGQCVKAADTATRQWMVRQTGYSGVYACLHSFRDMVPRWRYAPVAYDVSPLRSGAWPRSLAVTGVNNDGSNRTIQWDGCIEERATVRATGYDPIPSGANDLDIDMVPVAGNRATQWGPALPGLIWARNVETSWTQLSYPEIRTTRNYYNNVPFECPTPARLPETWTSASAFDTYVDSFRASGATYHDIGLIWGARLMSPTGIFRSRNQSTPQGGEIERHLIFMTDGDTATAPENYHAYGFPWLDRRQTTTDTAPTAPDLNDQVNARFSAVCRAVRNKGITLWVVSFGGDTNAATEARLKNCATEGRYFKANDSAALQRTFGSIANQISALRLID